MLHGAPLLLIPVGSTDGAGKLDGALVDGLDACTARGGQLVPLSRDGLPFSTATVPGEALRKRSVMERMTIDGVLYAVVLHKRPGSRTLSEHRICVGRSHGNDIVLRSSSVSKLHGWFGRDEGEQYFVVDAGSHNGTRVREVPLAPRKAMQLESGDVILFGSVEATFCAAEDFWDLVAAASS